MTLDRVLRWRRIDGETGFEHAHVRDLGDAITVRSVLAGANGGQRFGVHYELNLDPGWRFRQAFFQRTDGATFSLTADGEGTWCEGDGTPHPELTGCIDIDISATPVTNTLPMRRVAWEPNVPQRFEMAWVALDTFTVRREAQIYTWLGGNRWRFATADGSFRAILTVDDERLVVGYEGLFERVD